MSKLTLQLKRNVIQYHTGTLFNQKHAVRMNKSTSLQCLLSLQAGSAPYHGALSVLRSNSILTGCQHVIISGMITERHNIACRLILKASAKAPW